MKATKNIIIFSVIILFFGIISSCLKKGEDDPAISLRTRNNRIVGEWKLVSLESEYISNYTWNNGQYENRKTNKTFDGTNLTTIEERNYNQQTQTPVYDSNGNFIGYNSIWTPAYSNTTTVSSYSMTVTFKKDGTSSCSESTTQTSPVSVATVASTGTDEWFWLGPDKTFLEADCIGGKVMRLTNKELVIENNSSSETTGGSNPQKYYRVEKIVYEKTK